MAIKKGIHFMVLDDVKRRIADTEKEYQEAQAQLDEAVKMGDLRENSEYDSAKAAVTKIANLRDELTPVLGMAVVKSNDNIKIIEEGSIVDLTVWCMTQSPIEPGTAEFDALKENPPSFKGVLMYGATLSIHDLLSDHALSSDTAIGKFILGKHSGDYSVGVPGGFASITVKKLSSETSHEELYCSLATGK